MPAKEFYEQLPRPQQQKLNALFQWMANQGGIPNRQKFRQVEGQLFEFKSFQVRISCYRVTDRWILLHGFVKKEDKWRPGELQRAHRILAEHQQWELKRAKGGRT